MAFDVQDTISCGLSDRYSAVAYRLIRTAAIAAVVALPLITVLGSVTRADSVLRLASGPPQQQDAAQSEDEPELTLDQKFAKRFPQPVRVGDLIGLPVLDFDDSTIGFVKGVVRRPDGEVDLIVPYNAWFGWMRSEWGRRPVAVSLKSVAKLALQLNALEFTRDDFEEAPTWTANGASGLAAGDNVLIALGRR